MIAGLLVFSHGLKPPQVIETVVNQRPDTILVDIAFALTVVGAVAGTVDQTLVAVGDRTDAAGLADNTGAALGADLIKSAEGAFLADEHGIDCRDNHFLQLTGDGLNPERAARDQQRIGLFDLIAEITQKFAGQIVAGHRNHRGTGNQLARF